MVRSDLASSLIDFRPPECWQFAREQGLRFGGWGLGWGFSILQYKCIVYIRVYIIAYVVGFQVVLGLEFWGFRVHGWRPAHYQAPECGGTCCAKRPEVFRV